MRTIQGCWAVICRDSIRRITVDYEDVEEASFDAGYATGAPGGCVTLAQMGGCPGGTHFVRRIRQDGSYSETPRTARY